MSQLSVNNPSGLSKFATTAAVLYIVALLAFLLWQSLHFQIDYFDSFSVLKTAKGLAEGHVIDYNWRKPPLMSMILAPLFSLEVQLGLDGMAHMSGRLISLALFGALFFITFRLIALFLDRPYALAGALLLASNPLFIHNTPFCKDDLLGTLLASLAVYFYVRFYQNNKWITAFCPP